MEKEIRVANHGKIIARRVDEGYLEDQEILNHQLRRDSITQEIFDNCYEMFVGDEKSIRLIGSEYAIATVTRSTSVKVHLSEETPKEIKNKAAFEEALNAGKFDGIVDKKIALNIPSTQVEKVMKILKKNNIDFKIEYKTTIDKIDELKSISEESAKILEAVIKKTTTNKCTFKAKDVATAATAASLKVAKKVRKK